MKNSIVVDDLKLTDIIPSDFRLETINGKAFMVRDVENVVFVKGVSIKNVDADFKGHLRMDDFLDDGASAVVILDSFTGAPIRVIQKNVVDDQVD